MAKTLTLCVSTIKKRSPPKSHFLVTHSIYIICLFFPGPLAALTLSPLLTSRLGPWITSPMSLLVAPLLSGLPGGSRKSFPGPAGTQSVWRHHLGGFISTRPISAGPVHIGPGAHSQLPYRPRSSAAWSPQTTGHRSALCRTLAGRHSRRVLQGNETPSVSGGPGFPDPGKTTWTQPSGQDGLPLDVGPVS